MLRHIIMCTLKDELDGNARKEAKANIKAALEALPPLIEGLEKLKIHTDPLPSSGFDLMLESTFCDEDALKYYRTHPEHVKCIDLFRAAVKEKKAFDFYE